MDETGQGSPEKLSVLYCCNQCKGILQSKEAYEEHIIVCDGTVATSTCLQFVCDKTSLLHKETEKTKQMKQTKGKKRKEEVDKTPEVKTKHMASLDETPLKRPRRAAAVKLLNRWNTLKNKGAEEHCESMEKKDESQVDGENSIKNSVKKEQQDQNNEEGVEGIEKEKYAANLSLVAVINEYTESDKNEAASLNDSEVERPQLVEVKFEDIKDDIYDNKIALDEQLSPGGMVAEEINENINDESEERAKEGVNIISEGKKKTSRKKVNADLRRKWKNRMDKRTIEYIKSGRLLPIPSVEDINTEFNNDEENEEDDAYDQDWEKGEAQPDWKQKQLAGQPLWTVDYRAEQTRLKKMYKQYYQSDEKKENKHDDGNTKWERLPGYYQCPNCPVKMKKITSFHKHMARVHPAESDVKKIHENEPVKTEDGSEFEVENIGEDDDSDQSDIKPKLKFDPMDKFNPDKHISRQYYKRRRVEWAIAYEKYVVREGDLFSHYQCPACKYTSKIMGHFHRHISRIHTAPDGSVDGKVESWKCELCSFETLRKPMLKQHMLVHNRPFLCEYCPRRFGNKKNLHDHVMLHEGINPRQCPYCHYTTRQKRCLQEHIRKHTGELLTCSFCDFKTAYYAGMKMHILSKHKEKSLYPCNKCQYVTNDRSSHLKHAMIHRGDKDFQCSQCDYKSVTQYDVIKHMKSVHENQKLYFCDQCDYSSAYSTAFRNHIMIHLDLKPYNCSHCEYAAPQKTRVDAHVKSKHPADLGAVTVVAEKYKFDISAYKRASTKGDLEAYEIKYLRPSRMKKHLESQDEASLDEDVELSQSQSDVIQEVSKHQQTFYHVNAAGNSVNVVTAIGANQGSMLESTKLYKTLKAENSVVETMTLQSNPYRMLKAPMQPQHGVVEQSIHNSEAIQVVQAAYAGNQGSVLDLSGQHGNAITIQPMVENNNPNILVTNTTQQPQLVTQVEEAELVQQQGAHEVLEEEKLKTEQEQEVKIEQEGPSVYTYQIVDPQGDMHLVEVSHPLGVDENIVFVTEPTEEGSQQVMAM